LTQQQDFALDRRKRLDDLPELPEGRPALLLSAVYSGEEKKVYLKFYDPKDNIIYHWRDRTDHKPYCYTKMEFADLAEQVAQKETKYTLERVKKRDIISDKEIDVLKVIAPDPLSIGGTENSFREKVSSWEADIKYHENYLYDRALIPGLYYVRKDEQIALFEYPISEKVQFALKSLLWDKIKEAGESGKEYRQYITNWANLLNQPVPELKRVAVDIEVETEEGRMPNPRDHDKRVTAVSFVASDGFRKVLVLTDNTPSDGTPLIPEAEPCSTEKEVLEKAFRIISEYPIVITFNGDDFDLPYLYARSQDPRIDPKGVAIQKEKVPIMVKKESFIKRGMQAEPVGIRHGIHIDLYRTFDNKSIQIYAYNRVYAEKTLDAISEALLGDTKIEFEGDISDLPIQTLARYCLKDSDLTYRLTSKDDNLLMKLLVVIARIGRLSVDDIARFGVNQWIRGILYYEHRQRNELIPSRNELEAKGTASTTAVIKEKKYRGGEVVEPTPGIHFNVVVLDFACFDDRTEILTKDGWKNIDTLKQGDIGLSVNLSTGAVEEDPIQKIFKYDIDDVVYRIKTPRKLDFIFTPNHRMIYRTKKGGNNWIWKDKLEVKPLNKITTYHYSLPCFGKWNGKVSYYQTIGNYTFDTNDWLEFIGRFIGDGSFGTRTVQISENSDHHDKIESLCAIIRKLGFEPHIYREGIKNSVNIVINNKQFADALRSVFGTNLNGHNKHVPKCYMELSSEHLQYLLKGLIESDGSTYRSGDKAYATVSKQLADDFQLLALKCGYNCAVTTRISDGFGGKYPYYFCTLSGFRHKKASFVVSRQNPDQVSKEHYKGKVWCASTRNTTLIIRRKGRVIVTGNSLYPSIIKVHNLSYETINCPHDACRETKIEGTTHWVCKQKKGLTSLLIGSLRDLRVNYYKHLAKDKTLQVQERQLYNVVSQAIKVILNACFTADTDVLTPDGLRKISELKVGDKVYTLNEKTHKVEIKPIVEVQHYKYNDSLVEIKTKDINWQITGNHKLYLGKRKWGASGATKIEFAKIDASDAANTVGRRFLFRHKKIIDDNVKLDWCSLWKYIPDEQNTIIIKPNKRYDRRFADSARFAHYEFTSKLKRSQMGRYYLTSKSFIDSLAIEPQEFENRYDCKIFVKNFPAKTSSNTKWSFKASTIFELLGWYVTEGHARIGKSRRGYNFTRIAISQSSKHAANASRIASMIQELGIKPEKQTDRVLSFSSHIIANFLLSECGSRSRNKHLPSFVFSAPIELRKILFETMMCGDGNIKRGIYSSVSPRLADDFRHLAFSLGIETSVSKETLKSGSVIFRVKLFKREHHIVRPKDFALRPVKNLDVYCITAQDNHVVYAGREGKLGWIGQSYGVMGADIFPLYCLPVADAIAAIGRSTIHKAIDKCKGIGIEVVYSDTDSLFLKNPSPNAIDEVAAWARNTLGVDLEVDKEYRYVVFSDLKKNYLGVKPDGTVDVKGLTGKKSHTPPFIRNAFYEILSILGKVNSEKDFESAKESIKNVVLENARNLEARKIPLEELSFNVTINKSLGTYGKKTGSKTMDGKSADTYKGLPQHIKAAKMLADKGRELRAGDVISYVKTNSGEGVKPVELARPEEIDTDKYLETMESTFEQVLSVLNFDFKAVLGKPRQQSLDELFWKR
jgi:DNA polymerase elongation subunit (family B)